MLGSFGVSELMTIFIVGGVLSVLLGRIALGAGGPTLVLKRFVVSQTPDSQVVVEIVGRAAGLLGWLLGVLRLGAETSLLVTDRQVVFRRGSLGGEIHHVIALSSVASTHCGFAKSVWAFFLGIIFGLLSLSSLFLTLVRYSAAYSPDSTLLAAGLFGVLVNALIGAALLALYFFRRKLTIAVESNGGICPTLSFKRSIVENVVVDLPQVIGAIRAINHRVLQAQSSH